MVDNPRNRDTSGGYKQYNSRWRAAGGGCR
jgi:hypothetical protein